MPDAGTATTAETGTTFEITRLELANEYDHVQLSGWKQNAADPENTYTIVEADGVVKLTKNASGSWMYADCSIKDLVAAEKYTVLEVKVTGKAGDKVLFKVNGSVESGQIECTGELQTVQVVIENGFINPANAIMVFVGAGQEFASGELVIHDIYVK